ncbi:MAG: V-type ATPase subunit [Pirellulaceae bacterium]
MHAVLPVDLDFLVARLHGRRQDLAEGDRLDVLCRLRTVAELARAVVPETRCASARDLQHQLVLQTLDELTEFAQQLSGAGSRLMQWLRVRFQMENLKVLARVFARRRSLDVARDNLVSLPADLRLDAEALAAADSVESFAAAVGEPLWRQALRQAAEIYEEEPKPIVLEAALDHAYFGELIQRSRALPRNARQDSLAIARQETDSFHLMLVARGRFTYRLPPEQLAGFHVPGSAISAPRFQRMLAADTMRQVAGEAAGFVVEKVPAISAAEGENGRDLEPAILESLVWNRYLRLAHRIFRRSHMALGAVVAFAAIRRIELANLITLSEGIRMEIDPETIRSRLIPNDPERLRV